MIVLDTNVISELIRAVPEPGVIAWVDRQPVAELFITAITACELRTGIALLPRGRRRTALASSVEEIIEGIFGGVALPFDVTATTHYAELAALARRRVRPMSVLDLQIAAICRQHDAVLATHNIHDFKVARISVADPWAAVV